MAHFSLGNSDGTDPKAALRRPTLAKRRQFAQIRRYGVALLLACAVFFGLQSIADAQKTQTVVVTTRAIKRGMVLKTGDVDEQQVPHATAFDSALGSAEAATGLVAQTDMSAGSVVLKTMTSKVPALPAGLTVSEVRISHSSTATAIGDTVSLVSPIGCEAGNSADGMAGDGGGTGTGIGAGNQPDTPSQPPDAQPDAEGLCVLAQRALVMSRAHEDSSGETTVMELALTPQEAAATARVQEQTAVMVVATDAGKATKREEDAQSGKQSDESNGAEVEQTP